MAPKVDSLNIVSKTKSLAVVSNPEMNSNIEIFGSYNTGSNTDEITFSTASADIKPEEKSNKKRKWLISAGIVLGASAIGIASYLLLKKTPKNIIKPNLSNTNPQINSLIDDMTNFLIKNKGKHIGSEDIINIFKKHQPDIKLDVIDDVVESPFGAIFSPSVVASSGVKIAEDLSRYTDEGFVQNEFEYSERKIYASSNMSDEIMGDAPLDVIRFYNKCYRYYKCYDSGTVTFELSL